MHGTVLECGDRAGCRAGSIDLSEAQIYDSSTVAALDAIVLKYHRKGKHVEIIGMNEPSAKWLALSGNLGAGH